MCVCVCWEVGGGGGGVSVILKNLIAQCSNLVEYGMLWELTGTEVIHMSSHKLLFWCKINKINTLNYTFIWSYSYT